MADEREIEAAIQRACAIEPGFRNMGDAAMRAIITAALAAAEQARWSVEDDSEHRERLEAMVEDNGQTWDLSDNDKAAIGWALAKIKADDERWRQVMIGAKGRR